jgi:hypothetical protein
MKVHRGGQGEGSQQPSHEIIRKLYFSNRR